MGIYQEFGRRWNKAQMLKRRMMQAERLGNTKRVKGLASRIALSKRLAKELARADR